MALEPSAGKPKWLLPTIIVGTLVFFGLLGGIVWAVFFRAADDSGVQGVNVTEERNKVLGYYKKLAEGHIETDNFYHLYRDDMDSLMAGASDDEKKQLQQIKELSEQFKLINQVHKQGDKVKTEEQKKAVVKAYEAITTKLSITGDKLKTDAFSKKIAVDQAVKEVQAELQSPKGSASVKTGTSTEEARVQLEKDGKALKTALTAAAAKKWDLGDDDKLKKALVDLKALAKSKDVVTAAALSKAEADYLTAVESALANAEADLKAILAAKADKKLDKALFDKYKAVLPADWTEKAAEPADKLPKVKAAVKAAADNKYKLSKDAAVELAAFAGDAAALAKELGIDAAAAGKLHALIANFADAKNNANKATVEAALDAAAAAELLSGDAVTHFKDMFKTQVDNSAAAVKGVPLFVALVKACADEKDCKMTQAIYDQFKTFDAKPENVAALKKAIDATGAKDSLVDAFIALLPALSDPAKPANKASLEAAHKAGAKMLLDDAFFNALAGAPPPPPGLEDLNTFLPKCKVGDCKLTLEAAKALVANADVQADFGKKLTAGTADDVIAQLIKIRTVLQKAKDTAPEADLDEIIKLGKDNLLDAAALAHFVAVCKDAAGLKALKAHVTSAACTKNNCPLTKELAEALLKVTGDKAAVKAALNVAADLADDLHDLREVLAKAAPAAAATVKAEIEAYKASVPANAKKYLDDAAVAHFVGLCAGGAPPTYTNLVSLIGTAGCTTAECKLTPDAFKELRQFIDSGKTENDLKALAPTKHNEVHAVWEKVQPVIVAIKDVVDSQKLPVAFVEATYTGARTAANLDKFLDAAALTFVDDLVKAAKKLSQTFWSTAWKDVAHRFDITDAAHRGLVDNANPALTAAPAIAPGVVQDAIDFAPHAEKLKAVFKFFVTPPAAVNAIADMDSLKAVLHDANYDAFIKDRAALQRVYVDNAQKLYDACIDAALGQTVAALGGAVDAPALVGQFNACIKARDPLVLENRKPLVAALETIDPPKSLGLLNQYIMKKAKEAQFAILKGKNPVDFGTELPEVLNRLNTAGAKLAGFTAIGSADIVRTEYVRHELLTAALAVDAPEKVAVLVAAVDALATQVGKTGHEGKNLEDNKAHVKSVAEKLAEALAALGPAEKPLLSYDLVASKALGAARTQKWPEFTQAILQLSALVQLATSDKATVDADIIAPLAVPTADLDNARKILVDTLAVRDALFKKGFAVPLTGATGAKSLTADAAALGLAGDQEALFNAIKLRVTAGLNGVGDADVGAKVISLIAEEVRNALQGVATANIVNSIKNTLQTDCGSFQVLAPLTTWTGDEKTACTQMNDGNVAQDLDKYFPVVDTISASPRVLPVFVAMVSKNAADGGKTALQQGFYKSLKAYVELTEARKAAAAKAGVFAALGAVTLDNLSVEAVKAADDATLTTFKDIAQAAKTMASSAGELVAAAAAVDAADTTKKSAATVGNIAKMAIADPLFGKAVDRLVRHAEVLRAKIAAKGVDIPFGTAPTGSDDQKAYWNAHHAIQLIGMYEDRKLRQSLKAQIQPLLAYCKDIANKAAIKTDGTGKLIDGPMDAAVKPPTTKDFFPIFIRDVEDLALANTTLQDAPKFVAYLATLEDAVLDQNATNATTEINA